MPRRAVLLNSARALAAGAAGTGLTRTLPAFAYAGDGTMSKEEVLRLAEEKLTPFQRAVALDARTERAFQGKTTNGYSHDNKAKGVYVGAPAACSLAHLARRYSPPRRSAVPRLHLWRPGLLV